MAVTIKNIHRPDLSLKFEHSSFEAAVPAGFPSPAADYEEDKLDLNRHLVRNPAATYFVKASGDSMLGAGIHHGDLLIVDRSLEARDKNVVIAVVDGELTVKRIRIKNRKITLEPENNDYYCRQIFDGTQLEIWGVVTNVIHKL
jgi:DNA polymerase V